MPRVLDLFGGSTVTVKTKVTDSGNVLKFSSSNPKFGSFQIYERPSCYPAYAEELLQQNAIVFVSGTPGVGKTSMLYYIIAKLLDKTVVLRYGQEVYTRCNNIVRWQKMADSQFDDCLCDNEIKLDLLLLDSPKKVATFYDNLGNMITLGDAKVTVIASSPSERLCTWLGDYNEKRVYNDISTSLMPLWEKEEFDKFCEALDLKLTAKVESYIDRFGLLPRLICSKKGVREYDLSRSTMLRQLPNDWEAILAELKEGKVTFNIINGCHHCILLNPAKVGFKKGPFPKCSYYATTQTVTAIEKKMKLKNLDLRILFAFNGSGLVFEDLVQQYLASRKTVIAYSLEDDEKIEFQSPSQRKFFGSRAEFLEIKSDQLKDCLWCPSVKTWQTNDGFSHFGFIQVTVNSNHPISFSDRRMEITALQQKVCNPTSEKDKEKNEKIDRAIESLETTLLVGFPKQLQHLKEGIEPNNDEQMRFIFFVPEDRSGFKKQPFKGSDKNVAEYGGLIKQYVVYLSEDDFTRMH
eukprot:TRINITY_DN1031_c0_g1_i10.p1 TRINITY_DN1031_c0_g1~~TRINITY_DN1031_c0_g1_i10.p1  ORF type:complete len:594 (-),score=140.06 TRINITY_DN1031_c0_g1_i10:12035-13597(-)